MLTVQLGYEAITEMVGLLATFENRVPLRRAAPEPPVARVPDGCLQSMMSLYQAVEK